MTKRKSSKVDANKILDRLIEESSDLVSDNKSLKNQMRQTLTAREFILIALLVVSLAAFGIYTLSGNSSQSTISSNGASQSLQSKVSGNQALTESELKGAAALLATPIFWVGPIEGYNYVLDASIDGLIIIRYIPEGTSLSDRSSAYTAVGTYRIADAFETTQEQGSESSSSVGFINGDGAAVYYDRQSPLNVYMAYPGLDIQVEIFDPRESVAINAAQTSGVVRLIK